MNTCLKKIKFQRGSTTSLLYRQKARITEHKGNCYCIPVKDPAGNTNAQGLMGKLVDRRDRRRSIRRKKCLLQTNTNKDIYKLKEDYLKIFL